MYPVGAPRPDPVPGDAGVVAEVPRAEVVDPELGAVVEDAHAVGEADVAVALEPHDLRGGRAAGLNVDKIT